MRKHNTNKILSLFLSLLLVFSWGIPLEIRGSACSGMGETREQHYIVGFDHSAKPGMYALGLDTGSLAKDRLQEQILENYEIIDGAKILLTPEEAEQLEGSPGITYIEPDYPVYSLSETVPWGISRVYEDEEYSFGAWESTTGGGIGIAVLDSGIQANHEDLPLFEGYSTVEDTSWEVDLNGHGTHVAGIIAAQINEKGVVGLAPGISLYSVKVFGDDGKGNVSNIVAAIEWAMENDIEIINMSLGTEAESIALRNICDAAYNAGHLLFAAAGNSGTLGGSGSNMKYPAIYDSVIAVGATDSANKRAWFSSTGDKLELMAPGDSIYSTYSVDAPVGGAAFESGDNYFEITSNPLVGSGIGSLSSPAVYCGLASDVEAIGAALSSRGIEDGDDWVALIDRGNTTFAEKVRLVVGLGAGAAVIINDTSEGSDEQGNFTLDDGGAIPSGGWIPVVSISYNDGQILLSQGNLSATVEVVYNSYKTMKGTSMASPHAAGAAAMIWGTAPALNNEQIRQILNITAKDLGLPKTQQGKGLIRLNKALAMAEDVEQGRVFKILDWRVDEGAEAAEADLALKAAAGAEIQVLCALYLGDGRMSALRSYGVEVTEFEQLLTVTLPWDPLNPAATIKAFMTDYQFTPMGKLGEMALP